MISPRTIYHDLKNLDKLILGAEYETDSDSDDDDSDDGKSKPAQFTEEQLNKMTKDQLHHLLSSHGKRVKNKSRILKGDLIELIVKGNFNWRPADDKSKTTNSD